MNNYELAKTKLERAILLFQEFDTISETDIKSILHQLINVLELVPTENPEKYELYGQLRNLASREIKRYGAIFKAMDWKDSMIIRKEDVGTLIDQTSSLFY